MLSLRSSASIDLAEPLGRGVLFGGRGLLLYAATLVVAALLFLVRFFRFYANKRVVDVPEITEPWREELEDSEAGRSEADEAGPEPEEEKEANSSELDEVAEVAEAPARPLVRFAVYDFDETLTRATYPQAYDGTPFGCMALDIPWEDPRAGNKRDGSASKEFGGFDDARIAKLQQHFASMRDQGWTLAVLSYNLQWERGEFCLLQLLAHYGLLRYFTHQGTPLVYGLKDMRRIGATSKGDFVAKMVRNPILVTGTSLETAPKSAHLLVDDDEVNIAGARSNGIIGYQVAKQYEWDGLVGGLGRADPLDFAKIEAISALCDEGPAVERKRRRRRRERRDRTQDARWKK